MDIDLTRREALRLIAGGLCACGILRENVFGAPSDMLHRAIPKSGEKLPVIGLGTYVAFDGDGSGAERDSARDVLRLFVEHGGKVVDSSPMYGAAESVVGDLASELGVQKKLFIATKVWTSGRQSGIRQMEESMRKLRANPIDLMQVHNLLDVTTHLNTLRGWKKEGRIRYLGVTHYHSGAYDELERAIRNGVDFVQVNYSIEEREAEARILPAAADTGTAVIINRPFAQAGLFRRVRNKPLPEWAGEIDCASWAQFFLKYITGHPAVTCAIPATRNPKHLVDNMGAGRGRIPDQALRKRMVEYFQQI